MTVTDAWAPMIAEGFSPFKVVCSAHRGSQMVRRGGARNEPDGRVAVRWEARRGEGAPAAGAGIYDDDGLSTFELMCPKCRHPEQIRRGRLVALLRDCARTGQIDARGRVVLNLADLVS